MTRILWKLIKFGMLGVAVYLAAVFGIAGLSFAFPAVERLVYRVDPAKLVIMYDDRIVGLHQIDDGFLSQPQLYLSQERIGHISEADIVLVLHDELHEQAVYQPLINWGFFKYDQLVAFVESDRSNDSIDEITLKALLEFPWLQIRRHKAVFINGRSLAENYRNECHQILAYNQIFGISDLEFRAECKRSGA